MQNHKPFRLVGGGPFGVPPAPINSPYPAQSPVPHPDTPMYTYNDSMGEEKPWPEITKSRPYKGLR